MLKTRTPHVIKIENKKGVENIVRLKKPPRLNSATRIPHLELSCEVRLT